MWTKQRHVEQLKVNKKLEREKLTQKQLSEDILAKSLWRHSRVNCQCDEESPVSQANHIWLVLMGGRLVTGSQETRATLISMPAKRAVCVCVYACCGDKRNWQLTAGGKDCTCVRASCLTHLDILTMLMRDQQRTIWEFHADFVQSRWHSMHCSVLTKKTYSSHAFTVRYK